MQTGSQENRRKNIPTSLKIIAWLFILHGISAAIQVVFGLMNGHINLHFGVLGLFIGNGLFNLRNGWRVWGLVYIWCILILGPIIYFLMLSHPGPFDFRIFGQHVGHVSKMMATIPVLALFALLVWIQRVLSRPDIKELFQSDQKKT